MTPLDSVVWNWKAMDPHEVYIDYQGPQGYITLDGMKESYYSDGKDVDLSLSGVFYLGGISEKYDTTKLPHSMWAGMLQHGYVGCLQDLVVNGNKVDLVASARAQRSQGIAEYCHRMEPQCASHPCMHQGICLEGWNRFVCDCRSTGFNGNVCQSAAASLRFDGTQYVKVKFPEESSTEAEDISLRFRTMHPNGLLFMTSSDKTTDSMELYLDQGAIELSVNVGSGAKELTVGSVLNDDRWHTVMIKRRAQTIELGIDNHRPVTADMASSGEELNFRSFKIGHMMLDDNSVGDFSGFIGSMQQFLFNKNAFFELAKQGDIENIVVTARFTTDDYVVRDPVTFKSASAFATLNQLQAYDDFSFSFQFKTTEADGLLFYNSGRGQDFFAIELTKGYLYYIYNLGDGSQRIRANSKSVLNDNKWHEVRLLRAETYKQLIRVDDSTPTVDNLQGAHAVNFNLEGNLHVGGVRKTMYHSLPMDIKSRHGFLGCLGSLDLNGYLPHLVKEADTIHESVIEGCKGPTTQCQEDSCSNLGRCVQQWNSYNCDCDMTSYTGTTCTEESISYEFGPGTGLLTLTHPNEKHHNTVRDNLALGFRTYKKNAVLLRINSKNYDDYIELELVNGNIFVVYNMGTTDHPIGELFERVNDGKYHVVRFTRNGANSTIQVDDSMMQTKNPRGSQLEVFNDQAEVVIGGKRDKEGKLSRPFVGTISGLVLNSMKVLDLAKEGDTRISIDGDVRLVEKDNESRKKNDGHKNKNTIPDESEMQSTMGFRQTTPKLGVTDDIIYSGGGPGCHSDDEDDCTSVGSGNEDEIITPNIIIETTAAPPTTTTKRPRKTPCFGPNCSGNNPDESMSSTVNHRGEPTDDGNSGIKDSLRPTGETSGGSVSNNGGGGGGSPLNIGLIIGIAAGVLVAILILIFALYKFRSRDEGTYKVDESQNFSYLESKKQQGNGALLGKGEETGKRGKKKDVKEWYV